MASNGYFRKNRIYHISFAHHLICKYLHIFITKFLFPYIIQLDVFSIYKSNPIYRHVQNYSDPHNNPGKN